MLKLQSPLVTVEWLNKHLSHPDLIILDASIKKVTDAKANDPINEGVPGSLFFDIKNKFSDTDSEFPNTWPSTQQFQREARKLGINNSNAIVIYDDKGIYSSARAWYLFKAFGHNNVAVLDGGLPNWIAKGLRKTQRESINPNPGNFEAEFNSDMVLFFDGMKNAVNQSNCRILDARSEERFKGRVKEPREGLRSGTIPNSESLPYTQLMSNGLLKSIEDLQDIFNAYADNSEQFIFSCGSGITACVLALGAELAGYDKTKIYDGSWTEWGTLM